MLGEAAALQEESARAFDALLGPDHPRSIGAWVLLAGIMRSDGRLDEAETLLRAAMERDGKAHGEESPWHATILRNLAALLYNAGELGEADQVAARVQRILEGSENSSGDLTSILVIRCGIDLHSGAFRTAEERCRRASEILRDDGFSERNAVVIAADCRLGAALELQGRSSEAAAVFDRVLAAVWESRTLHKPGDVHHCLSQAAAAYEAVGRGAEAGEARERAAGMSRRGLPGVARD